MLNKFASISFCLGLALCSTSMASQSHNSNNDEFKPATAAAAVSSTNLVDLTTQKQTLQERLRAVELEREQILRDIAQVDTDILAAQKSQRERDEEEALVRRMSNDLGTVETATFYQLGVLKSIYNYNPDAQVRPENRLSPMFEAITKRWNALTSEYRDAEAKCTRASEDELLALMRKYGYNYDSTEAGIKANIRLCQGYVERGGSYMGGRLFASVDDYKKRIAQLQNLLNDRSSPIDRLYDAIERRDRELKEEQQRRIEEQEQLQREQQELQQRIAREQARVAYERYQGPQPVYMGSLYAGRSTVNQQPKQSEAKNQEHHYYN
jgi:chromosome segregation ATPase